MFEGYLDVHTRRGRYRQPRSFQSAPALLERMMVDVGDQTNVLVVVVAVEPRFEAGEEKPSLMVTAEEASYHEEQKRFRALG
jgi:hypothetical protein